MDKLPIIKFAESHPASSTASVAQALGITSDAAYRLCKKHLVGRKGPKGTLWSAPGAAKARAVKRTGRKDKPTHPVHRCASVKKAESVVKMLEAAWSINASCAEEAGEHVILVPSRQKRAARALVTAFRIGAGEPANDAVAPVAKAV
jgi:hypothetical protein